MAILAMVTTKQWSLKFWFCRRESANKTSVLYVRRADFMLIRKLVSKVAWENTFEGTEVHQCWSLFKQHPLKAQEQATPKCWKSSG